MTSSLITGLPASIQLIASGGTPPYVYSIASGLPAGLSLNASTGLITGTPTTLQTATALVWGVQDSASPTPATSTDSFLVTVAAVPLAPPHYQFVPRVLGGMLMGGGPYPAPELYVAIASQPMTMAAVVIVPVPVVVAIAGRPMTMAAAITPITTVDVAITGRPMTMAAAVQNQSVDVAITGQPMTMAAVMTEPVTADVAIVGSPMTMDAAIQDQSINVAIAGSPMTISAAISGAEAVDTGLYTGNGTSQSITTGFQPDLIWIKPKASSPPTFVDSTNGASLWFDPSSGAAFATDANAITSFNSDGFSVGNSTRVNTNAVVNRFFAWKESATFEVVTYTGNGAARAINHSLGVAPAFIMVKRVNGTGTARGYHKSSGATIALNLNTTSNSTTITVWNNTAPTTTVFSLGTSTDVNANGSNYVAYLFAESTGITKVDAYTGNGSATGPVVDVGFAPKIVGIRRSGGSPFHIYSVDDSSNPFRFGLDAESTTPLTFLSNGFQPASTNSDINTNAVSYHYVAWG